MRAVSRECDGRHTATAVRGCPKLIAPKRSLKARGSPLNPWGKTHAGLMF
jgi:hypothetical protein